MCENLKFLVWGMRIPLWAKMNGGYTSERMDGRETSGECVGVGEWSWELSGAFRWSIPHCDSNVAPPFLLYAGIMSSSLVMTSRLNREIEATISRMMNRMRSLSEQMRIADDIISQMDGAPLLQDAILDSDDESSWSDYEHQNIDSSDDEDDAVSFLTTEYRSEYYDPGFMSDSGYDSDEETVVDQWEDPYMTPEKPISGIIIPSDVDAGLELLV